MNPALVTANLLDAVDNAGGDPEWIRSKIASACLLRAQLNGLTGAALRRACYEMGDLRLALKSLAGTDRQVLVEELELLRREMGTEFVAPVLVPGGEMEEAQQMAASLRFSEASSKLNSYLVRYPRDTEALLLQIELLATLRKWERVYQLWLRIPAADWCETTVVQLSARLFLRRREFESAKVCFTYLDERGALPAEFTILRELFDCREVRKETVTFLLSEWLRTEEISEESLAGIKKALALKEGALSWSGIVATAAAAFAHARVLGRLLTETLPTEVETLVKEVIGRGWFLPKEAFKIAGRLKRAEQESALRFYGWAHAADPRDEETLDTFLRLEYDACARDVFRSRATLDSLLRQVLQPCRRGQEPANYKTKLRHGRVLRMAERFADALATLEGLAREYPSNPAAMRELVLLFQSLRDTEAVTQWSRRILELCPDDEEAKLNAGRADRIQTGGDVVALTAPNEKDGPAVWLQYLGNLFFVGDFNGVLLKGEGRSGDSRMHLLLAAASIEVGELEKAELHLNAAIERREPRAANEIILFRFILEQKKLGLNGSLSFLNSYFTDIGASPIHLDENYPGPSFDRLAGRSASSRNTNGPLVSVIMTCGNVVEYVDTAVRSILQQSYENLELLVVDDGSTDGTAAQLRKYKDPRLILLTNEISVGPYVSKNRAMKEARGDYIAFQDADDWSHPDRISRCLATMEEHTRFAALRTQWIRMTSQGELQIRPRGGVAENCCIALFMRRVVLERIGFFDSVRVDADIEYVHRLRLAYGPSAFPDLPWMLMFGRIREGALTSSGAFAMTRGGYNRFRQSYREAYRSFHRAIVKGASPYMEFPLSERKFEAPPEII